MIYEYLDRGTPSYQISHLDQIADALGVPLEDLPEEEIDDYYDYVSDYEYRQKRFEPRRKSLSRQLRQAVWDRTNGRCWYCGAQTKPFADWRPDHLIPHSKGGSDDIDNLVPSCHRCNSLKSDMSLEQFRRRYWRLGVFWFERMELS